MGIVVIGDVFIDIKGYSTSPYIPQGRNAGTIVQLHGGVGRNVVEDIANVELEPTFVSLVDDNAMGDDVIQKLKRHKVNTNYMRKVENGMGTWLAVFNHEGDVVASISKRPDHRPVERILDECGDEIFKNADSIVIEIDTDKEIVKKTFHYAEKYGKKVYALVSNMTIAIERRDFLRRTACFVCNQQEAGILFSEDYEDVTAEALCNILAERIRTAQIPQMVVTMGGEGAVYVDENGNIKSMTVIKMELGEPDASGRRRPIEVPGSEYDIEVDTVIMSLGTSPNPLISSTTKGLDINRRKCIVADEETGQTSKEGVYAGGDAVTGAATVILAMGAGKAGAKGIDEYLKNKEK